MDKKKMIAGVFLIVLGLFFFATTIMPNNTELREQAATWERVSKDGVETKGAITSVKSHVRSEGTRRNRRVATVYCGVYEFAVRDSARTVEALGDDCTEQRDQAQHAAEVAIVYDAADPSIAFVKSAATETHFADADSSKGAAFGIGGALILVGALAMYAGRPRTPEQLAAQEEKRRQATAKYEKMMAEINTPRDKS